MSAFERQCIDQFLAIAEVMQTMSEVSDPTLSYCVFSDAIYWSDEIPDSIPTDASDCLRVVLRYRTSLIMECPDTQFKPVWDSALGFFPNWIGFLSQRTTPLGELKKVYVRYRKAAFADLPDI